MRLIFLLLLFSSFVHGQQKPEFLNFNTAKLNDSIPGALTKGKLLQLLGKPTRIEEFETDCASSESREEANSKQFYWYDSTRFVVYHDSAELREINFRNNRFSYKTTKFTLSGNTTVKQLSKIYPIRTTASIKVNRGKLVTLESCSHCDGYCFLYFENGRLIRLLWYQGC